MSFMGRMQAYNADWSELIESMHYFANSTLNGEAEEAINAMESLDKLLEDGRKVNIPHSKEFSDLERTAGVIAHTYRIAATQGKSKATEYLMTEAAERGIDISYAGNGMIPITPNG